LSLPSFPFFFIEECNALEKFILYGSHLSIEDRVKILRDAV
jgi:hypothetical protein